MNICLLYAGGLLKLNGLSFVQRILFICVLPDGALVPFSFPNFQAITKELLIGQPFLGLLQLW